MKIEIKDLTFSFDGKKVLKNISFDIEQGGFLALMGPNGSGKTTLLRCLMNYLQPESGAVLIDAKSVHTMSDRDVARLFAVVPQSSQIEFSFTAYEMVTMGRIPHARGRLAGESRTDADIVRKAMDRTNTWAFADRSFGSLSGGERQRIIIARALAQNPKILLLDEPTVYLDITGQFEIMDLLRELNRAGLTIIAVLHDINLASRYCKKVALLNEGRLEASGTPEEVFTQENIIRIYDVDVVVRRDPITKSISVIPKITTVFPPTHGTRVHVLCGGGSGGSIIHELLDAGFAPSMGVVNVLDSDFEVAKSLHVPVITEIPFAQISDEAAEQNLKMIGESEAVVVSDFPIGPGNLKNLEAARKALELGKRVAIMVPDSIRDRDFVGGKAKNLIEEMLAKGAIAVNNHGDLLKIFTRRTSK